MPQFNANITFMFREHPVLERFDAAKEAGFSAVEILSPEDASIPDLVKAAKIADIDIVLCNAPMGDFLEGGPGLSAVPGREEEFRKNFEMVVAMASAIDCLQSLHYSDLLTSEHKDSMASFLFLLPEQVT